MHVDLSGSILLVTGGSQGIGERVARLAAQSGAAGVFVTGRDVARTEAVASEIAASGTHSGWTTADLAAPEAASEIFAAAKAAFGRVDLLVSAAGVTDRAGWADATAEEWDRLFAINARAPFLLMQAVLADLRARRAPGAIVTILSMIAHCGTPDLAVYAATKGALAVLSKNAAHAHLGDRIRVNGINVGWADTPGEHRMQAEVLGHGAHWRARVAASLPLGRLLSADEVAQLAVFLLSPQAGLLTGTLIDLEQWIVGGPPAGLGAAGDR